MSFRKAAATLVTSVLIVSLILYAVFGTSPSSTFWLTPGVYPGAPSYTIWREGNTYFAKDANGKLAYSSSNVSDVTQSCIDSFPSYVEGYEGGVIEFEPGQYIFDTTICISNPNIILQGQGYRAVELVPNFSANFIKIYSAMNPPQSSYTHGIKIRNLLIYDKYDMNATAIYFNTNSLPIVWFFEIENVFFIGLNAIHTDEVEYVPGTNTDRLQFGTIRNVIIENAHDVAIKLWGALDTVFDNVFISWTTLGEYLSVQGTTGIQINSTGYPSGMSFTNLRIFRADHGLEVFGTQHMMITNAIVDINKNVSFLIHDSTNVILTDVYGHAQNGTALWLTGTTENVRVLGAQFADSDYGVVDDTSNGQYFNNVLCVGNDVDWTVQSNDNVSLCNILFMNEGTASMSSSTTVVVDHGLYTTPSSVTFTIRGNYAGITFWISAVTSTTFTITASGSGSYDFYWRASI